MVDHGEFVELTCKTEFISLEIVEEMIRERLTFTGGREIYLYCDVTRVREVEKQARDYLSTGQGHIALKGIAIFVNSTLTKFIANFIIKVCYKDSPIPIRLFLDSKKAVSWLAELRKNEVPSIS